MGIGKEVSLDVKQFAPGSIEEAKDHKEDSRGEEVKAGADIQIWTQERKKCRRESTRLRLKRELRARKGHKREGFKRG